MLRANAIRAKEARARARSGTRRQATQAPLARRVEQQIYRNVQYNGGARQGRWRVGGAAFRRTTNCRIATAGQSLRVGLKKGRRLSALDSPHRRWIKGDDGDRGAEPDALGYGQRELPIRPSAPR